jgi:hypothetical protein
MHEKIIITGAKTILTTYDLIYVMLYTEINSNAKQEGITLFFWFDFTSHQYSLNLIFT